MNEDLRFPRIRAVLSHTSHPGNIGAAARALKTMGLTRLYLINPKHFPDPQATAMACGAHDLLENAVVCSTLDEALTGVRLAIAVTARRRELSHLPMDAREAAQFAVAEAGEGDVAMVFGTEMSGLSNDEVIRCQRLAHIATNPDFSSLNLAAAVQVIAYELHMAIAGAPVLDNAHFDAANIDEIENFFGHLESNMVASGFLDPAQPKRLMERLRRLYGRTRLEKEEVNILRGMLNAWDHTGARRK